MPFGAPEMSPQEPYMVYGKPATSMGESGFSKQFGSANTKAGAKGEQILFTKLRDPRTGWLPADVPLFCSLRVPGKKADIDFAACLGNRILLIDAKYYKQDGGIFWNWGSDTTIRRNFSPYTSTSGNVVTMSRSMEMAANVISQYLPGYHVESMVVFTTDPSLPSAKIPHTRFLTYPGGVKVYNDRTAQRFIASYFGRQKRTIDTHNAEVFLKRQVQR